MALVNTPDEEKYKFYSAPNGVFKFKVSCSNDCHVALSNEPREDSPKYEIIIGGWYNKKSAIRQVGKQPDLVTVATPAIVSANELRGFWIRWHHNAIRVGREGETASFMSYVIQEKLFSIKYVGIYTSYGSTGSWLFDANAVNGDFASSEQLKFERTPDEKKYKFYPARGDVFAFKVCCSSDCHVALSTQPQEGLPMYEIVLGGWSNTMSAIRQIGKHPDLVNASTPAIVNENEWRGFWIRWHGNLISVGCEGEDVCFMSYMDPKLFPVTYVGISTGYGSTGYWLFSETHLNDVAQLDAIKDGFADIQKITFVKTPNEKRYKFYPANGGVFAFNIYCSSDCHVALTTQPQEGLPMYEIVLGGWNNTKSVIRQIGKQPDLVEAPTPHILNANEVRGFWIRWHDNIISVGRKGETVSFMNYKDPNLFPVKYVGICSAYGSTGHWLFEAPSKAVQCGFEGNENLKVVKTPNEKIYKFYPARDGHFTFKVFCSNDCHVALSTQPQEGLPMYEIVLGGCNNTKSVIRQIEKQPVLVEASTPAIVNENELRSFWIRWQGNVISVGCNGEDVPFMSYKDPKLFPVKYVGICTAYGSTGFWLFADTSSAAPKKVVKERKQFTFAKTGAVKAYKFIPVREGMFTFQVCCQSACHIALSTQPLQNPPMYEIVIGGWKNSKSVIRQIGMQPPEVDEAPTPRIVDANEMREFWIRWQDNVISVGRKGETVSFLSHKDPQLFPIKYVGISTGYGSTGSWVFEDTAGGGVWVPAANGVIPPNALKGGFAGDENFMVARAQHEGNLLPGRLHPSQGTCYVTHKGSLLAKREYEVLCSGFGSWSPVIDGNIPANAVVGGYTDDGESLFIGRAQHLGTLSSGKVQPSNGCCYIAYGSEEIACTEYEIYIAINDFIK